MYSMCDELCYGRLLCVPQKMWPSVFFSRLFIDFVNRKHGKWNFVRWVSTFFTVDFGCSGHAYVLVVKYYCIRFVCGKTERRALTLASLPYCGGTLVLFVALCGVPTLYVGLVFVCSRSPLACGSEWRWHYILVLSLFWLVAVTLYTIEKGLCCFGEWRSYCLQAILLLYVRFDGLFCPGYI